MKRRIIILSLFLLAGVLINVAVSWGCAFWLELDANWHDADPFAVEVDGNGAEALPFADVPVDGRRALHDAGYGEAGKKSIKSVFVSLTIISLWGIVYPIYNLTFKGRTQ